MLLDTDFILPETLTGYVRTALADQPINQFTLASWLPYDPIDDIDFRVFAGGAGLADMAVFRTYDAEAPIGRRIGGTLVRGELPPISQKFLLNEYERLRRRASADQDIPIALYKDAARGAKNIAARFEVARGQALATGIVTIAENGVAATVDFQRSGAHTVTAATLWSAGGSDPITDLTTWFDVYTATNGEAPGALVTSRRVALVLLRNAAVRNQVFPGANQPSVVKASDLNLLLEESGLPPIYIYRAQVNINKVATKVLPDNVILMLPAAGDPNSPGDTQLGATFLGTTIESTLSGYGLEGGEEPGIVAGVYSTEDPPALWTKVAAIGMPVLANPNLSLAATVL